MIGAYLARVISFVRLSKSKTPGGAGSTPARTFMKDTIDWSEVRRRIQEKPIVFKPKHVRKPNRSPESVEKRKIGSRKRSKKYYWNHREELLEKNKQWAAEHPERIKAKKKRYYEKHKQDPEWLERKRARQREYKRRKKLEKLCYNAA